MNRVNALRYLLLKHLWLLRKEVTNDKHVEISHSLKIYDEKQYWVIKWSDGGVQKEYKINKQDVFLYQRGDSSKSIGASSGVDLKNEEIGLNFAKNAFGLNSIDKPDFEEVFFSNKYLIVFFNFLIISLVVLFEPVVFFFPGLIMFIIMSLEFWYPRGRRILIFPATAMFFTGLTATAFAINIALLILHYLDTDPRWRIIRCVSHFLLVLITVVALTINKINPDIQFIVFIFLAGTAFIIQWIKSTQFRFYTLLIPIFGVGFFVDGYLIPAYILILSSLLHGLILKSIGLKK